MCAAQKGFISKGYVLNADIIRLDPGKCLGFQSKNNTSENGKDNILYQNTCENMCQVVPEQCLHEFSHIN